MSHETKLLEELAAHTENHHVGPAASSAAITFLFPRNLEKLEWFIGELADVMHRGRSDDPYMIGFRDALFEVFETYHALLSDETGNANATELVRSKAGWRQILEAMFATGQGRPSELAALTGMDQAQVSRALAEMREAELVEHYQLPELADRRARPHSLSSLGITVLDRLGPGVPEAFDKAFELAAAVFARLATDRRLTERTAAELAKQIIPEPHIDAPAAAKHLLEAAARRGLVVEQEGAHLGADLSAQGAVYRLLIDALDKHRSPAFLDAVASAASPKQNRLVIRSARPHDLWHIFFKRVDNPFGDRAMIVDGADLIVGSVEPPGEPYALLYESASLLKDDHAASVLAMRKLEQKASRRLCLTSPTLVELEKGYEAIPVAA